MYRPLLGLAETGKEEVGLQRSALVAVGGLLDVAALDELLERSAETLHSYSTDLSEGGDPYRSPGFGQRLAHAFGGGWQRRAIGRGGRPLEAVNDRERERIGNAGQRECDSRDGRCRPLLDRKQSSIPVSLDVEVRVPPFLISGFDLDSAVNDAWSFLRTKAR